MDEQKKIFIDLDGTLIDNTKRIYECYKKIVSDFCETPISEINFWKYRNICKNPTDFLKKAGHGFEWQEYNKFFLDVIENVEYLIYDTITESNVQKLMDCKQENIKLILLTARRNRENLIWQLRKLNIFDCFSEIINTSGVVKSEYMKEYIVNVYDKMVGDTLDDYDFAVSKKIEFVRVISNYQWNNEIEPYSTISNFYELSLEEKL